MNEKRIGLEEIKSIELELLKQVHILCKEKHWRYSLCGGTLLGAVRHGGFIPWDDDIDIFMPRPDYNEFVSYCKVNELPFRLVSSETDTKYSYLFAKIINPNTIICETSGNRNNIELGVYIDIFPIDGLGDTYEQAKKQFTKTRFNRELLVAYNWKKFFRSKTHSILIEPFRLAFFVLSRFAKTEKIIKRVQSKYPSENFEISQYAGVICGSYRLKEILPIATYKEYETIVFENQEFMTIKNKDVYLKSIYGDYMQLPPVEKRISHHTFEAYYK